MKLAWTFDSGRDDFAFADDTFRSTTQPKYASGTALASGGTGGSGALQVRLGGIDGADIAGMSGDWSTSFTLTEAENVTLTFR